jgi:predicted permease
MIQSLRVIRTNPAFSLVTILTLGLAIGANTTIFSLANGLLFKRQPGIGHPEALVDVGRTMRGQGFDTLSYPNYKDYASHTEVFSGLAASTGEPTAMSLRDAGSAESIYGSVVTANYFDVLQVKPTLGRFFLPEDDTPGTATVVLSSEFWNGRFGRNPSIIGREIVINGHKFTVIGVAAEGFHGANLIKAGLWVPMGAQSMVMPNASLDSRGSQWLVSFGRLRPDVSLGQAQGAMSVVAQELQRTFPDTNREQGIAIAGFHGLPPEIVTAATAFMALLMAIVAIILAIACANVAGIALARSTGRQREMAVRLALGAGRGRLIRQVMSETLILFLIAAAVGMLFTSAMTQFILSYQAELPFPLVFDLSPDYRVVAFTLVVTLFAALLSGLGPALQSTRTDVLGGLKEESGGTAYRRLRLRNALVVAQIAMSLLLLIASGLFVRALSSVQALNPGFDTNDVQVVNVNLFLAGYTEQSGPAFDRDLLEHVSALPGVESASLAVDLPLDGTNFGYGGIRIPERQPEPPYRYFNADWNVVAPGYFKTMRIDLLKGRDFRAGDSEGAPRVAIINEALAQMLWPGEEALGKILYNGEIATTAPIEVIGVSKNIKDKSLGGETEPFIYAPLAQFYVPRQMIVLRTASPSTALPALRAAVRELNPNLPIVNVRSLRDVTALGLLPQRLAVWVAGTMGIVGMLLAALGIYGVTAYNVGRRTREIGIRVALGARPASVLRLVLREGLRLTGIGLTIGFVAAIGLTWLLKSLLFGIAPTNALTFIGTSAALLLITLLASYVPARRAVRVDPMIALRHE